MHSALLELGGDFAEEGGEVAGVVGGWVFEVVVELGNCFLRGAGSGERVEAHGGLFGGVGAGGGDARDVVDQCAGDGAGFGGGEFVLEEAGGQRLGDGGEGACV